jgi:hypothetical protein
MNGGLHREEQICNGRGIISGYRPFSSQPREMSYGRQRSIEAE